MVEDGTLLREYAQARSEAAFAELVRRHLDLVYSAALRQVNGDKSLAEDVCQSVFIDLARKAARLSKRQAISGWLYTSACFAAGKAVRSEQRRREREQKAHEMREAGDNAEQTQGADWASIRPIFDEAMLELKESDRQVLLERFCKRRSLAELGLSFGLSENAARMRVERALERLRERFLQRGITSSTAALAFVLAESTVVAAPVALAGSVTVASISAVSVVGTNSVLNVIAMTKLKTAFLGTLVIAGVSTPLVLQYRTNAELRAQVRQLQTASTTAPSIRLAEPTSGDSGELERLRRENAELLRLRGEVTALRQQLAGASKGNSGAETRATEPKRMSEEEEAKLLLAKSPEVPMIPARQWNNVGFGKPASAYETLNWAVAHRDTNAFSNALMWDAQAKQRADALFSAAPEAVRQRFGSVDAVIFDWFLNNSTPVAAARVLSEVNEGANDAALVEQHIYTDGRVRENTVQFARDETGAWRQVVPQELMPKLEVVISNLGGAGGAEQGK